MKYLVVHAESSILVSPSLTDYTYILSPRYPQRYYCSVSVTTLLCIYLSLEETSIVNMGRNIYMPNHWIPCIHCNFGPQAS